MNPIRQGDVYLVRWDPSVGHEFQKIRPGIVISSNEILRKSNLVTFMPITSSGEPMPTDIQIKKDDRNILAKDSIIKVGHVSSFDKSRLVHYIGFADELILQMIRKYLVVHFGL